MLTIDHLCDKATKYNMVPTLLLYNIIHTTHIFRSSIYISITYMYYIILYDIRLNNFPCIIHILIQNANYKFRIL